MVNTKRKRIDVIHEHLTTDDHREAEEEALGEKRFARLINKMQQKNGCKYRIQMKIAYLILKQKMAFKIWSFTKYCC